MDTRSASRSRRPSDNAVRELLPELEEHLASMAVLLHQYLKHTGLSLEQPQMNRTLRQHSSQVFWHMHRLGGRMVRLGGVPAGGMLELVNYSYLEPEPEGRLPSRTLLRNDLELETLNLTHLRLTHETARELRDPRTARMLRGLIWGGQSRVINLETILEAVQG